MYKYFDTQGIAVAIIGPCKVWDPFGGKYPILYSHQNLDPSYSLERCSLKIHSSICKQDLSFVERDLLFVTLSKMEKLVLAGGYLHWPNTQTDERWVDLYSEPQY